MRVVCCPVLRLDELMERNATSPRRQMRCPSRLRAKPGECVFHLRMREMPDFRLNEVAGDIWRNGEKAAIANCGYLLDFAMMFLHESQMGDESREVLPAGKGLRIDHHSMKLAVGFDIGIDVLRYSLKITRFK